MRKFIYCLLLILVAFFWVQCGKKTSDVNKIEQIITNYTAAFDKKDFHKFTSFATNDFKFYTLDGHTFDKDSTISFLDNILKNWSNVQTTIKELEIECDHSLSFARYEAAFHFTAMAKSGTMSSLITVVFRKTEDTWKMIHFHMSRKY